MLRKLRIALRRLYQTEGRQRGAASAKGKESLTCLTSSRERFRKFRWAALPDLRGSRSFNLIKDLHHPASRRRSNGRKRSPIRWAPRKSKTSTRD